ncbi:MAG: hypothetical protein IJU39_01135 [Clostridia bacterium]|nr:hypothetical protein [Clostridia bacterium]
MNEDGQLLCENPDGGYIEEMKARQLVISVNSFFRSSVISYFTISFEPYGLGKKIVTDNIYKTSYSDEIYYSNGTIFCPIYDYVAVAPKVSIQIDGYETDSESNISAIYKSGIMDLNFSESLVGDKVVPDLTNARLNLMDIIGDAIDDELAVFAAGTDNIEDGAITSSKIQNGAVTKEKLSSGVQSSLDKADTALQEHQDISGKADISDVPTKTSDLQNDSGFLTSHQDLSNYVTTNTNQLFLTGAKHWYYDNKLRLSIIPLNGTFKATKPTTFSSNGRYGSVEYGNDRIKYVHDGCTSSESDYDTISFPKKSGTIALTDDLPDVSDFITSSVNDLVNYYKKSETYTQSEVNALINALTSVNFQVVQSLPTQDVSASTIYLLPRSTSELANVYDEYIFVSNNWEKIGTTEADLTNYYTKTQSDAKYVDLSSEQTLSGAKKWLAGIVFTVQIDKGSDADGGSVTLTKLDGSVPTTTLYKAGAIVNKGKTLTLPSAADGTVATLADIPTRTSDLQNDSGFALSHTPEKAYYSHADIVDITSALTNMGNYYIGTDGNLNASSANDCFKLDLTQHTPTSIRTATRSTSWLSYAFYSTTTDFDEQSFISGGALHSTSNFNNSVWNFETVNISEIPANAKSMLVVRYTGAQEAVENFFVKGEAGKTVRDCFDEWLTDDAPNSVIYKPAETPAKIYRVGSGRTPSSTEFTTLIGAVAQWVTDGKPCATIFVDSGVYVTQNDPTGAGNPLTVKGSENRLTIIGEDKDSTVVKSTTGKYIHPAINIQGGNVTVKNITFIADHSDNPSFAYLDPDRESAGKAPNSAYAVHCDGGSESDIVSGIIEFENCNMWSYQSCALGCGTVVDGHVIVKSCDIRSFVPGTATDQGSTAPDATAQQKEDHAIYYHGTRGAIVYHMSPKTKTVSGQTVTIPSSRESFTLIDSSVYLKGGTKTVCITNSNETDFFSLVTFIGNTFWNDVESCNLVSVPTGQTSLQLGGLSGGNNLSSVNSNSGDYSLAIK